MKIVQRSGIYPDHSAYHVGGHYVRQFTPEALRVVVVTIPLIWGIALTVWWVQMAARMIGGNP